MPLRDRRATRRANRLNTGIRTFFDPEREHPWLKKAFELLAPIAVTFLTSKLPTWLSGLDLSSLNPGTGDEPTKDPETDP